MLTTLCTVVIFVHLHNNFSFMTTKFLVLFLFKFGLFPNMENNRSTIAALHRPAYCFASRKQL